MSGYVAADSTTEEKPSDKYGIEDVVYIKAHGEGRTKLIIDQVLGEKKYKVRNGLLSQAAFTMSAYKPTDGSTGEKPSDEYGRDVVYAKAHGEGKTKLIVDQVLGERKYKVRKDLLSQAAFTMSGYVAADSTTEEKLPDKYGIEDVVYKKAHGEGKPKLIIDQILGNGRYKVWKDSPGCLPLSLIWYTSIDTYLTNHSPSFPTNYSNGLGTFSYMVVPESLLYPILSLTWRLSSAILDLVWLCRRMFIS